MPVKKSGKKFSVNNTEYATQDAANKAYMDYVSNAMGAKKKTEKIVLDKKK